LKESIFITGGTGFLGTELISQLIRLKDPGIVIHVLVRAANEEEACHRLRAAWQHDSLLCKKIGTQIFPVTGDLTDRHLGLTKKAWMGLRDEITLIFHCGAQISFQEDADALAAVNVGGTKHVLAFASHVPNLKRFIHISTAYVAGQKSGRITEEEPAGTTFSSLYEKSKARAEKMVRESGLPFAICRPGMIVGNSRTGRVKSFNTIYYVLKLYLLGGLRVLPIDPQQGLNLVPVDYVAGAVMQIGFSDDACGKTFHLTCPDTLQPQVGELTQYVRQWAKDHLAVELPKPVYMPLPA